MNKREIDKKLDGLSDKLDISSGGSRSRIDPGCFSEQERALLVKVTEILENSSPDLPPAGVMLENYELFSKASEIIVRRAMELFAHAMPRLGGGGEIDTWFFNQFFYNFLLDYTECLKTVYNRSEKERQDLLSYLQENDKLNVVYRIRPSDPTTFGFWAITLGWDDVRQGTKKRNKQGEETK
jgi:hypothetical protein